MSNGKFVCCVHGCASKPSGRRGIHFYSFPGGSKVRKKWIEAVSQANSNGPPWELKKGSRICNMHFVGGKKSSKPTNPAFSPTIFPDHLVKEGENLANKPRRTKKTVEGRTELDGKRAPRNRRKKKVIIEEPPDSKGVEGEDVFDEAEPEEIIVEPEIKQHFDEIDLEPDVRLSTIEEISNGEVTYGPDKANGDKDLLPEDPEAPDYTNSLTFFFCGEGSLYYTCFQCGRRFTSMVFLRRHEEKHFSLPFPCGFCSRAFKLKSSLLNHTAKFHQNF